MRDVIVLAAWIAFAFLLVVGYWGTPLLWRFLMGASRGSSRLGDARLERMERNDDGTLRRAELDKRWRSPRR